MSKNPVKYIHLRALRRDMNFFRDPNPFGGKTVAFEVDEDLNVVLYGVARVHPRDRYVKAVGRDISRMVLQSDKCNSLSITQLRANLEGLTERARAKLDVGDLGWEIIVHAILQDIDKREQDLV